MAGADASAELLAIAAERTPGGDFRVADLEALPWADGSFDLVTGFSSFQFAQDKVAALREAARVERRAGGGRRAEPAGRSSIAAVLTPLAPLFPPGVLDGLRRSGIFALSAPGALDSALAEAGLRVTADEEVDGTVGLADPPAAVRAFLGTGATALALAHSGEPAVADALRSALVRWTAADGSVHLPASYRCVLTERR